MITNFPNIKNNILTTNTLNSKYNVCLILLFFKLNITNVQMHINPDSNYHIFKYFIKVYKSLSIA